MSYEVSGKLITKFNTIQRSESFKTRDFVIAVTEDVNGRAVVNYIKFSAVQDATSIIDQFKEGDNVTVYFNVRGTRWEKDGKVNYITSLNAWKVLSKN